MTSKGRAETVEPELFTWSGGSGGGAIEVVVDTNDRAFGWLCDEGHDDRGVRSYGWFLDGGASGKDSDYGTARAALGAAAALYLQKRRLRSRK